MAFVQKDLLAMQNLAYREFHKKLIPTIKEDFVIGVPVPQLRKYAKTMIDKDFLKELPHTYYEENMLHGLLVSLEKDMELCLGRLNSFLPFVDNWAVCDSIRPKCFGKNKMRLLEEISKWLVSSHQYTVRFAIEMLMVHFLEEDFKEEYLQWVSSVKSQEYYVNMMISWYFATALSKQWECALPYITEYQLSPFVHNKTIQKAVESYCISKEKKQLLKLYRNR